MTRELGVVMPYWLDRPDEEALDIALAAERAGIPSVWIGELATFDAIALATAVGLQTERIRLKIGPLAVAVRSPVALAQGVASVATLIGRPVDIALGSSSPVMVSGWHDRPWTGLAARMRETVVALRRILDGERLHFEGDHVRVHGFRLRRPQPGTSITVAAFGPAVTRIAARHADEVVLNLVTPAHLRAVRARIDAEAASASRPAPRLAVWVPAALDPGQGAIAQLAGQLAVYLGAPGYGELFTKLGFGGLVADARAGRSRRQLAAAIPLELITQIAALGSAAQIADRVAAYHDAGADHVAVAPATAEDPAARRTLAALTREVGPVTPSIVTPERDPGPGDLIHETNLQPTGRPHEPDQPAVPPGPAPHRPPRSGDVGVNRGAGRRPG